MKLLRIKTTENRIRHINPQDIHAIYTKEQTTRIDCGAKGRYQVGEKEEILLGRLGEL